MSDKNKRIKTLTSKAAAEKAMKKRCDQCKQMEEYMADSIYFGDGESTVEDLIEFRKYGFMSDQDGKKCACATMTHATHIRDLKEGK